MSVLKKPTQLPLPVDEFPYLRAMVEHSPDPLLLINGNQMIEVCNLITCRIANQPYMRIIGKPICEVIPGFPVEIFELYELNNTNSMIFESKYSDVETYHWDLSISKWEDGGNSFFIASLKDISEKIENEKAEEIERSQNFYKEKMKALGDIAAGMAHEINNPLTIVQMNIDWIDNNLTRGKFKLEQLQKVIREVSNSVQRMAKITHGLLAFARDGSNDAFSEEDLKSVLEDAAQLSVPALKAHKVTLEWEHVPSVVTKVKRVSLSQVLFNVIDNAIYAAGKVSEKWVKVDFEVEDNEVIITVTDSGKGISPEYVKRVFVPFFSTKEIGEGTGLGLSISRGILKTHGGTIEVGEDKVLSSIVIRLPLRKA